MQYIPLSFLCTPRTQIIVTILEKLNLVKEEETIRTVAEYSVTKASLQQAVPIQGYPGCFCCQGSQSERVTHTQVKNRDGCGNSAGTNVHDMIQRKKAQVHKQDEA